MELTQEQKLQKIIERAVERGYKKDDLGFITTFERFGGVGWDESSLIFSHSFLEAYFGEELLCYRNGHEGHDEDCVDCLAGDYLPAWKHHAQVLATTPEEERISYLYRFVE